MRNQILSTIKPFLKPLLAIALVIALTIGNAGDALAARSGGRIGGGSFRMPSRSYSAPNRTYAPPSGGYYPTPFGGGFGFPFLLPFFGFGGGFGGLFTILLVLGVGNFLLQSFRRATENEDGESLGYTNSKISVAQVQVGLLASGRGLQAELDQLAKTADTSSETGRAQVIQESALALLRHPEYWVYGSTQSQKSALELAEAKFNQLALAERSKFTAETLTNVNSQIRSSSLATVADGGALTQLESPGEYIIVTILAGVMGDLSLPVINSSDDLRQALRQIGGISSDRLLALEILWTPQADGDTLTTDDIMAEYPNLKLV